MCSTSGYRDRTGTSRLQIEVWIDDDGLVRRIKIADPPGARDRQAVTIDLYDFGVNVVAEAPPADQVMTERELGGAEPMTGVDFKEAHE